MAELTAPLGLAAFLSETARRPFVWGETDCLLRPADWVRGRTGRDPAAPWRGRYASQRGAARIIARAGGVEALFAQGASAAGLEVADVPRPGDVGLVRVGEQLVGAVRTGRGWAVKTPTGIWVHAFPALRAWRV